MNHVNKSRKVFFIISVTHDILQETCVEIDTGYPKLHLIRGKVMKDLLRIEDKNKEETRFLMNPFIEN